MKNLPTYEQFNEQYLPYFGVKQALDDSNHPLKEKVSDFHRIYSMTPVWWTAWKKENEDKYEFKQDAFSRTYEVKDKDGKVLFVFDYGRNKIFTNEKPEMFTIKSDISPEELEKIKDSDVEDPDASTKKKEEEEKDSEKSAEDEDEEENPDEFKL